MGFAVALPILRSPAIRSSCREPTSHTAIAMQSMEQIMTRPLRRAHLARGVAGAVSTLVLCATAAFTIARHFAL
jgi:hypothetical protein